MIRRFARALPLALAIATSAGRASAAPPEDVKRAETRFREGQKLLKSGHVAEACAAFAESQRLDPAVGTLLNLAECHAQERRFASAHAEFLEAARVAHESGQRDRESFAKDEAAESEAVLSYVELHVAAGIDVVAIDEKAIPKSAFAKLPLDPGAHTLVASGAGKMTRSTHLDVANGPSSQPIDVAALEPSRDATHATPPAPSRSRDEENARTVRIAGLATAGAGVLAIGIGTIFGLRASGKKSDAEPHCTGHFCDGEGLSLQDDAHSAATVSTVAFVIGVLAVSAGTYLYLSVPRPARGIAQARVVPTGSGLRLEAMW